MADFYLLSKLVPWSTLTVRDLLGREVPLSAGLVGDVSHGSVGMVLAFDSMEAAAEAARDGDRIIPMCRTEPECGLCGAPESVGCDDDCEEG